MRLWIGAIAALLAVTPARAGPMADAVRGCPDLTACLAALDRVAPAEDTGVWAKETEELAQILAKLGHPAKAALLARATGDRPGLRNLAGSILSEWPEFTPADVPALAEALRLDRGGWVARPLGRIGTPEAIQALVADLDTRGQSEFALQQLGAKALPYLLPLLEGDDGRRYGAARVISEGESPPAAVIDEWAQIARSPDETRGRRTAALRALEALGPRARHTAPVLRPLLEGPPPWLRDQAFDTLHEMRDPFLVPALAEQCRPSAPRFDGDPYPHCVLEFSEYGADALPAASALMRFLASENGAERAAAASALGYVDYRPATPDLVRALGSNDWREVYVSARSLGWLGAIEALPELDRVAAVHWLPEVRRQASRAAVALRSADGRLARPAGFHTTWDVSDGEPAGEPGTADAYVLDEPAACDDDRWAWDGRRFDLPRGERGLHSLRIGGGRLEGIDRGEWGGALTWTPTGGEPQELLKDNVHGLAAAPEGAVATFGLAHIVSNYGYALRVTPDATGGWRLTEIGTLPGQPGPLRVLGRDLYAVHSESRVVVFTSKRILGLATCAAE
ncbi:HEAT repeat domain-containing protein [Caulobacter sp. 17J65-9]|uniref:HEAT repeat domain-containing protein n=1 Tax=Caulobacter sp. 17J65-9 TaxID=2709382 RepID=UPI0013C86A3D|nr:HEAT repeat domain-containing protein [Caulobacter sp. 17J65-9]NEX93871.1 HEAT repeat domain-containing protein [Caulobacter sp. 17J65-9]